jgi:hypothetical protein
MHVHAAGLVRGAYAGLAVVVGVGTSLWVNPGSERHVSIQ